MNTINFSVGQNRDTFETGFDDGRHFARGRTVPKYLLSADAVSQATGGAHEAIEAAAHIASEIGFDMGRLFTQSPDEDLTFEQLSGFLVGVRYEAMRGAVAGQ